MTPRVSAVIPAYNAARFLRECVESVLAQTHADLEVIVVNDGSTDTTADVLASFGHRIRVLEQPRAGQANARNRGAAAAQGEWLAFLDADDVWLPLKVERQLARAAGAVGLVYSNRYNIGARGSLPEVQGDVHAMYEGSVFPNLLLGNVITTSSVMVPRAIFESVNGFSDDPRIRPAEDWDLWLRIGARHPIALCPEPLVKYRFQTASESRNAERMSRARVCVIERAMQLPAARALSPALKRRIWARTYATNGWDAGRHSNRRQAITCYARAIERWPFEPLFYRGLLKACIGRP